MECPLCYAPMMLAPASGPYCPALDCEYNTVFNEPEKNSVKTYELQRRKRDGMPHRDMSDAMRIKMRKACNQDREQAKRLWRAIRV